MHATTTGSTATTTTTIDTSDIATIIRASTYSIATKSKGENMKECCDSIELNQNIPYA